MTDLPTPDEFACLYPLRVRWPELDPQGIVYNPNYFMYFDLAATEYLRAVGFAYPEALHPYGADIFTVSASANFRASAKYEDELTIGVRADLLGRASIRFRLGIFRGAELLCDGALVQVTAKPDRSGSTPLPPAFVAKILAFEKTAPARK